RPAVAGGRERQDSVAAGLRALPAGIDYVVIHDGARPFATAALVERVLAAARRHGAALAAVPVHDTIKRVSPDLFLDGTVDRRALWLAQTPQAFSVGLLREAHAQARAAGLEATDDAALVEALGHPVRVVPGSRLNFKITTREDLALARLLVGRAAERALLRSPGVKREHSRTS
ncbi:MAG: 2-C-methyl-D-erythritol 4-phosphate cytidylyltransferase, partial [Candidatus Methylomirabilia bacterium]